MNMKAIFELEIHDNRLYVLGQVPYVAGEKLPQIILGKNARVTSMSFNGRHQFEVNVSPDNDYFRIYTIGNENESGTIFIEYDTFVEGENNILSEEVVALSLYSNTFPSKLPDYIEESTCYFKKGFEQYDIIHYYVDNKSGLLAKDSKKYFGEIANIVGFRKGDLKSFEVENIKVYYRKESSYPNLFECAKIGAEAFSYYNQIYPHKEAEIELIVLGIGNSGAYCRGNMMVTGIAPEDFHMPECMPKDFPITEEDYRVWLKYTIFTHELGHIWFCHADTASYEDWLNETGAEWSSLLFLLHKGEQELFRKFYRIREYEHEANKEAIKPKDLHRPNAVHGSGVVLFYMIYEKYGKDTVMELLSILSKMETQTTDGFIVNVESELGKDIADFIKGRLEIAI